MYSTGVHVTILNEIQLGDPLQYPNLKGPGKS